MTDDITATGLGMKDAFKINEAQVRGHVDRIVVESVEQTLNGLLEEEAKALCGAGKYERTDARKDTRADTTHTYQRNRAGVAACLRQSLFSVWQGSLASARHQGTWLGIHGKKTGSAEG